MLALIISTGTRLTDSKFSYDTGPLDVGPNDPFPFEGKLVFLLFLPAKPRNIKLLSHCEAMKCSGPAMRFILDQVFEIYNSNSRVLLRAHRSVNSRAHVREDGYEVSGVIYWIEMALRQRLKALEVFLCGRNRRRCECQSSKGSV